MNIYTNNMSIENPEEEMNNNIWDRMFVISGAQEVTKIKENENISARPTLSNNDKYAFELGSKLQYKDVCTGNRKKMEKHNLDICTYGNTLTYFGPAVYNMTFEKFWLGNASDKEEKEKYDGFIGFINKQLDKVTDKTIPVNFYLGTHHNRLKHTIFSGILDTENKRHFANACCIKMSKKGGNWQIEFIFDGYPDKADTNYFKSTGNPFTNGSEGIKDIQPLVNILSGIKGENVSIYIIRHGNAFHNKPLRLVGTAGMDRPLDSCLTPLGILQAEKLGEDLLRTKNINPDAVNVWCTSYMNRAMLTILQVMNKVPNNPYKRLKQFRKFMIKFSMSELYKRIKHLGKDWNEIIHQLTNDIAAGPIGDPDSVREELDSYMGPEGIYYPEKYLKKNSDFLIANIKEMIFPPKGKIKGSEFEGVFTFGEGYDGGKKKKTRRKRKYKRRRKKTKKRKRKKRTKKKARRKRRKRKTKKY